MGRAEPADGAFQSSPGPKTGCHEALHIGILHTYRVSILTRPEDRVPPYIRTLKGATQCFNPHPARRPGATPSRLVLAPIGMCFNPHPARRPGATYTKKGLVVVEDVFQSSPGPKTGCH